MTQSTTAAATSPIDLDYELTKGFAARYIRAKARRLIGHAALKRHDREDIQQELTLAVLRGAESFDPSTGDWKSFVATIVERIAARGLIERRRLKRRLGHDIGSLDITILDADGVEVSLASQIPHDQSERTTGRYAPSDQERAEAAHDVAVILESAPPRTRELCEQLMHSSEREVIEQLGTSRRTLREHLKRLRRKHAPEEFQKYPKRRVAASSANRKA
ncbi:MAG: sigma-70 family RNA polymerase sigma factor [Planctomycetaceae bacterium]